jgi:hypothetical protein
LHDRSESPFSRFEKDDPAREHDPETAETSFSEADRAQTYSVQQQFGG